MLLRIDNDGEWGWVISGLSQTKALGYALEYIKKYMKDDTSLAEATRMVIKDIEKHGIDIISEKISGHFAAFRSLELAFTLNRIRGFDVRQKPMHTA